MESPAPPHGSLRAVSPECPRCGYDLSGAVAAWADTCPVEGVCSECGLVHRWAEVLNPLLTVPAWSFEHARRGHSLALARTVLRTFRPKRLWSTLRMEHPVRAGRLLAVPLLGFPLTWGVFVIAVAALLFVMDVIDSPFGYRGSVGDAWHVATFGTVAYGYGSWHWQGPPPLWVVIGAAWWCALPLAFLALPVTLRRAKLRPAHLLRIWPASHWPTAPPRGQPGVAGPGWYR